MPPEKGVVSLEGGSNGSLPGPKADDFATDDDTIFRVVDAFDGEITCGQTETLEGGDVTLTITRGDDTDGGCKGFAERLLYNFEAGTEGTELFVDFVTEPVVAEPDAVAQFLEVITWRFEDPPNVDAEPPQPQHRTLFYDDHLTETENKRVMPWCLADPRVDGSNALPAGNPADYVPLGHTSCLISSSSRVTGFLDFGIEPGTFIKVDTVYNFGDGKRWT